PSESEIRCQDPDGCAYPTAETESATAAVTAASARSARKRLIACLHPLSYSYYILLCRRLLNPIREQDTTPPIPVAPKKRVSVANSGVGRSAGLPTGVADRKVGATLEFATNTSRSRLGLLHRPARNVPPGGRRAGDGKPVREHRFASRVRSGDDR